MTCVYCKKELSNVSILNTDGSFVCNAACLAMYVTDKGLVRNRNVHTEQTIKEGIKHDADKIRLELLPIGALEEVSAVLTEGAKKYQDWNWKNGMRWSRLIGALLRHTFAYARGCDRDAETGRLHLAHAVCCALFLLSYQLENLGEDDRQKEKAQ